MILPILKYNIETEEHLETITTTPEVKFEDKLKAGGFFIQNIKRNKSDVYHVKI